MSTARYAELFLTEGREHLSAINHALLALERDGGTAAAGSESVATIFRAVHTIKGMSATMGYAAVAELSHELESLLDAVRRGTVACTREVTDALFAATDTLERGIELSVAGRGGEVDAARDLARIRAVGAALPLAATLQPATAEWTAQAPSGAGQLVRVRLAPDTPMRGVRASMIVQALRAIGDVSATAPSAEQMLAEQFERDFAVRLVTKASAPEIERVARGAGDVEAVLVDASERAASAPASDARADMRSVRIDARRLDRLMNLVGELVIAGARLERLAPADDPALAESVTQAGKLIAELRDEIVHSRMVPVAQVFDRFPRLVRDAARSLGKEVEFTIEGKGIELDRSMLDEAGDAIVHLLRNAVDHGIEPPDVRVAAGKPAAGRLLLSASRDRNAVTIRVSDDGRGAVI